MFAGSQFAGGFDLARYLGETRACFAGYSLDEDLRGQCASGGIVSALLVYLLRTGKVQGAVVSRLEASGGRLQPVTAIVTDPHDVARYSSSFYADIPVLEILGRMRVFRGALAVVGLPCHIAALRQICRRDASLRSRIRYTIGLFCGGNTRIRLLQRVIVRGILSHGSEAVKQLKVRRGHVGGVIEVAFAGGGRCSLPFRDFNLLRMLWIDSKPQCVYCPDHTAERADISVGDIFTREFKREPIRHSAVICRTAETESLLEEMASERVVALKRIERDTIFKSQKRALILHKNLASRSLVGRLFGYTIPASADMKVRWNDCLVSAMILMNTILSKRRWYRELMLRFPRFLLFLQVLKLKLLCNF